MAEGFNHSGRNMQYSAVENALTTTPTASKRVNQRFIFAQIWFNKGNLIGDISELALEEWEKVPEKEGESSSRKLQGYHYCEWIFRPYLLSNDFGKMLDNVPSSTRRLSFHFVYRKPPISSI